MKPRSRFLLLAGVLVLGGCGETNQQVIDRYRPQMEAVGVRLKAIHGRLPATLAPLEAKLNPAPVFAKDKGNTEILAEEQLLDVHAAPAFELNLSPRLRTCLMWTGPKNPMAASALARRDKQFEKNFQRALEARYLVALRTRAGSLHVDEKTFSGGAASLEAFVVDLKTDQLVAATAAEAAPEARITYSTRPGENKQERAAAAVHSSTWENLRDDLAKKLGTATGGTFDFR